jgi:hypothetical protein
VIKYINYTRRPILPQNNDFLWKKSPNKKYFDLVTLRVVPRL